jgi:hypothetical protein
MILISENFDLLSSDEQLLLKNKCDNFIVDGKPTLNNNYYYRYFIDSNDTTIKGIIYKITQYIQNTININDIDLLKIWINRVTTESNQNDEFHTDMADLSFLLYLNDDFDGGEFEYMNRNKKIKIKPKLNLSIITNNTIYHRVSPVTSGERFSLVMFFNINKKKEITLL